MLYYMLGTLALSGHISIKAKNKIDGLKQFLKILYNKMPMTLLGNAGKICLHDWKITLSQSGKYTL